MGEIPNLRNADSCLHCVSSSFPEPYGNNGYCNKHGGKYVFDYNTCDDFVLDKEMIEC